MARLSESRAAWPRAVSALEQLVELASDSQGTAYALRLAAAREKAGDAQGVEDALKRALALQRQVARGPGELRALYEKGKKWSELAALLVEDADLIQASTPRRSRRRRRPW